MQIQCSASSSDLGDSSMGVVQTKILPQFVEVNLQQTNPSRFHVPIEGQCIVPMRLQQYNPALVVEVEDSNLSTVPVKIVATKLLV